jgi:hypothetical protein
MALCSLDCSVELPKPLENVCKPQTRNGGISRILFAHCGLRFENVYDLTEWCRYLEEGWLTSTHEVLGQKPKASATRKKQSSCRSEQVIGFDYSVTFQDYNADNSDFSDYDFWNTVQSNQAQLQVGFLTCDGHLYGFQPFEANDNAGTLIPSFTSEISNVIEDDFNGSSYWDGSIEWKAKYEHKPIYIAGLAKVLATGDCSNISPYANSNLNPPPDCSNGFSIVTATVDTLIDSGMITHTYNYQLSRLACCTDDIEVEIYNIRNTIGNPMDYVTVTAVPLLMVNPSTSFDIVVTIDTTHPDYTEGHRLDYDVRLSTDYCGERIGAGDVLIENNAPSFPCFTQPDYSVFMNQITDMLSAYSGSLDFTVINNIHHWISWFNGFDYTGYPFTLGIDTLNGNRLIVDGVTYEQSIGHFEAFSEPMDANILNIVFQLSSITCDRNFGIGFTVHRVTGIGSVLGEDKLCCLNNRPHYEYGRTTAWQCLLPIVFNCVGGNTLLNGVFNEVETTLLSNDINYSPLPTFYDNIPLHIASVTISENSTYNPGSILTFVDSGGVGPDFSTKYYYIYASGVNTGLILRVSNFSVDTTPDLPSNWSSPSSVLVTVACSSELVQSGSISNGRYVLLGIEPNAAQSWLLSGQDYISCSVSVPSDSLIMGPGRFSCV